MKNANVKATIIKSVSAVLCTLLIAYAGISNTEKICENRLALSSASSNGSISSDVSSFDSEAGFDDAESEISDDNSQDVPSDEAVEENTDDSTADVPSSDSEAPSEKQEVKKKITLTGGLSSTKKEEVLEYYKLVSKKNANLKFTKTLTLVSMNGGKNMPQRMIDIFIPIAQKALEKNTITDEPYPGKPEAIQPSDWLQAKAVNDGTYTTVYVKVVPQTDGYNGKQYEGSCGRTMSVLDGIDQALAEMNAVSVDFSRTKMNVKYVNPTVKLKVKNSTGELVKGGCEWKYDTNPNIETMEAKFLAFNIHIEDAGGVVSYSVKY